METLSHIADKLEAQRDFNEQMNWLIENEPEIVGILDNLAWEKQVRPVMKVNVVSWFGAIDYEIDPRIAEAIAGAVRALYPMEPSNDYGE